MSVPEEFTDRCVVVTGAGNGLGRAYALRLGSLGASVVVNDLGTTSPKGGGSDAAAANAVVAEIVLAGGSAVASAESVSTAAGGRAIIEQAMDTFGRVDAVINNAGIQRAAPFDETTDEDFDAVLDVHVRGAFFVSRPAFSVMKRQGYGRLVFTASSAGLFGAESTAAYATAKGGLVGMMNVTAIEGAPFGILSNVLMPAAVTRMGAEGVPSYMSRIQKAMETMGPERLNARGPEFVAPLAAYLVSESCTSNGSIFSAVLGRYARVFIGLADGWLGPADAPATLADLRSNLKVMSAIEPFVVPDHLVAEFERIAELLAGQRPDADSGG